MLCMWHWHRYIIRGTRTGVFFFLHGTGTDASYIASALVPFTWHWTVNEDDKRIKAKQTTVESEVRLQRARMHTI